jgi:hypothetical protein
MVVALYLSIYICIYTYIYIYIYICIYIYIYIYIYVQECVQLYIHTHTIMPNFGLPSHNICKNLPMQIMTHICLEIGGLGNTCIYIYIYIYIYIQTTQSESMTCQVPGRKSCMFSMLTYMGPGFN